jgi:beta-glucosidase
VEDLPPFKDYAMTGRTYRYFDGEVSYPFGWGLSYTHFSYDQGEVVWASSQLSVRVTVKNLRDSDGDEVVQVYFQAFDAPESEPRHELVGFMRVPIKAGTVESLIVPILNNEANIQPGSGRLFVGGRQPEDGDWLAESGAMILHV